MAGIKSVEVNGVTYNVPHASAMDQKRLMLLIGAKIALHSASAQVEEIDRQLLLGALTSLPETVFDDIAGIVLGRVVKHGEQTPVDIGGFQGDIFSYFQLVAECVKVNLDDFFTYLDGVNKSVRPKRPTPPKSQ